MSEVVDLITKIQEDLANVWDRIEEFTDQDDPIHDDMLVSLMDLDVVMARVENEQEWLHIIEKISGMNRN